PRQEEALGPPFARDIGEAGRPGRGGIPSPELPSGKADDAAPRRFGADQEPQELALSGARQSRQPDDLALAQREARPPDGAAGKRAHLEQRLARRLRDLVRN